MGLTPSSKPSLQTTERQADLRGLGNEAAQEMRIVRGCALVFFPPSWHHSQLWF